MTCDRAADRIAADTTEAPQSAGERGRPFLRASWRGLASSAGWLSAGQVDEVLQVQG